MHASSHYKAYCLNNCHCEGDKECRAFIMKQYSGVYTVKGFH